MARKAEPRKEWKEKGLDLSSGAQLDQSALDRIAGLLGKDHIKYGSSLHVDFEGAGNADLDLVFAVLDVEAGIYGSLTKLEFTFEDEVGVFFLGPNGAAFLLGAAFDTEHSVFGAVPDIVFRRLPTTEVFAIKDRLKQSPERCEKTSGRSLWR